MGIPLITNSGVGDVERIVTQYSSGIVIDEFTRENFTACCRKDCGSTGL